ncbi:MAG: hypothetical protein WC509_05165 [Candidatus Izemoplasmatales bacterium]
MSLQDRVIEGTLQAVAPLKADRIAIHAAFYAALVFAFYMLLVGAIDWVGGVAAGLGGVLYSVVRDFSTARRYRRALASHLAYVQEKHPHVELYVPMVEKLGNSLLLKRSGLFLEDGRLSLEAFNQPAFAKSPKDSITVPVGVDFRIFESVSEAKVPLVGFRSELMKNAYRFHVYGDEEAVARIAAFAESPAPADAASAEPERND